MVWTRDASMAKEHDARSHSAECTHPKDPFMCEKYMDSRDRQMNA